MVTKYYPYILLFTLLLIIVFHVFVNRPEMLQSPSLGNLHTHTTCSDGHDDYETMIQSALDLNFKFIAITDHKICPEVIQRCLSETRIYCIPGLEITSNRTHLLAINITKTINPYQPITKQVAEVHAQGGLAIAAHPYVEIFKYTPDELTGSGIDAMECTDTPNEPHPLPCIFTSDAHRASALKFQYLSCMGQINTFSDLKNALFSSSCSRSFVPNTNLFPPTPTPLLP
ncbi:MAG: PHP domain-containing protein [Candidatus Shapirobacteria bacterium]|jgi:hypothetical protein